MQSIGFVCYDISILGGTEQVAVGIANALSKNYKVHIISVRQTSEAIPYQINEKVKVTVALDKELRLRQSIVKFPKAVGFYLKENNIKVLLTIGDYAGIISLLLRCKYGTRLIFCEHGALMNQWKELDVRFIRLCCAKWSHHIVTLTKVNRESYIKKFHIKPDKISFIYNWIDQELLKSEKIYDETVKKILTVGRFTPEKGYNMLVEIAKQILPIHPDWIWDLYGDGECFEEIQEKIKKAGLGKQLHLKGSDSFIKFRYHEYAFYVMTSYREGLPVVLLEAKANRLPAVSFDILTGPREIIENGINGYLVHPYSIEEMVGKIEEMINDSALRKRFSDNTEKSIDKFSQKEIVTQWENLIEQYLKG